MRDILGAEAKTKSFFLRHPLYLGLNRKTHSKAALKRAHRVDGGRYDPVLTGSNAQDFVGDFSVEEAYERLPLNFKLRPPRAGTSNPLRNHGPSIQC